MTTLLLIWPLSSGAKNAFRFVPNSAPADQKNEGLPVHASANHAQFTNNGTSLFIGKVHITQGDQTLNGGRVFYDKRTGLIRIPEFGSYRTPYYQISGREGYYNLNEQWGGFQEARYHFLQRAGHGTASAIEIRSPEVGVLRHATYTTCPPSHVDWRLNASKVHLDRTSEQGTAYNTVLDFMGVPVFYAPVFSFPLTDKRKTGFLVPVVGVTGDTGFDLTTPYYLNLAPNYDATLYPRITSRRGFMLGSQFRYKTEGSYSTFFGNYLPYDMELPDHDLRYRVDFKSLARFTDHLAGAVDYNRVSDDRYFDDLGSTLQTENTDSQLQQAQLVYQRGYWLNLGAKVSGYQNLKQPFFVGQTYDRLPELSLNARTPFDWHGLGMSLGGTYTYFHNNDAVVQGTRLDWQPALHYNLDKGGYFLGGSATYERTDYHLFHVASGRPAHPDRGIPIYEANAGLRFERIAGHGWLQTLEPQLYYLYVPYKNQTELPIFDTFGPNFGSNNVFSRGGFFGKDRVENANRVTAGFSTRLVNLNSGKQKVKFTLAQVYRFSHPRVAAITTNIPNPWPKGYTPHQGFSDTIAELEYQITRGWSAKLVSHMDQHIRKFVSNDFSLQYRAPGHGLFNVGYNFNYTRSELVHGSFDVPVTKHWDVLGRWDYSLQAATTTQVLGGIGYHNCCVAVRLAYRHYLDTGRFNVYDFDDAQVKNAGFLQIQFKGLATVGSKLGSLLHRDIVGYTPQ